MKNIQMSQKCNKMNTKQFQGNLFFKKNEFFITKKLGSELGKCTVCIIETIYGIENTR